MGELTICKKKPILHVEKNYHDHEKLLGPSRWFVILHLWDKLHGVMLTACPAVLTTQPATDRGKRPLEFVLQRPCGVSAYFLLLFQPFFFPSDLRVHLLDQVCQQCLTFLSGLGVHIAGVFLPSGQMGEYRPSHRWSLIWLIQPVPGLRRLLLWG